MVGPQPQQVQLSQVVAGHREAVALTGDPEPVGGQRVVHRRAQPPHVRHPFVGAAAEVALRAGLREQRSRPGAVPDRLIEEEHHAEVGARLRDIVQAGSAEEPTRAAGVRLDAEPPAIDLAEVQRRLGVAIGVGDLEEGPGLIIVPLRALAGEGGEPQPVAPLGVARLTLR